ncbi:MAG: hypothetical protein WC631_01330 [Candidatus Paceibacterota bacterium]|jgi:hypothetical protein
MNKQKGFLVPLAIVVIALLVIGSGVYVYKNKRTINPPVACTMEAKICPDGSAVGRIGPKCEFAPCPTDIISERQGKFDKTISIKIKDKIVFSDGLSIILEEINDSRCKPDVQCFWQGELSALFSINKDGYSKEIRLGTVNNKKTSSQGYTFSLEFATEDTATIIVSVNSISDNASGINGYLHLGPVCPVMRIPPDPNCADKPFVNAEVDITAKDSGILVKSIKSDTNGHFNVNIAPGIYIIKITPDNGGFLPRCEQKEIVVVANRSTDSDISCDTGIR